MSGCGILGGGATYGRHLLFMLTVMSMLVITGQLASASSVGYYRVKIGKVTANVVRVNLQDPRVRVMPILAPAPPSRPHPRASFKYFLDCYRPVAAINGTFFDTRTFRIIGNLACRGRLLREGYVGNTIAIDRMNRPRFLKSAGQMGRHTHWGEFKAAIGGGLTLLVDGRMAVNPRRDGFRDPGLFRLTSRSAIGFTRNQRLLMVNVGHGVSFHELARIMKRLGAVCAVSLDGGSSTAMYYRGRVVASPRRVLTNLLAVFEDPVPEANNFPVPRNRRISAKP